MSLGITNNRRSPLETNRSFIFPHNQNRIWTTEPAQLLQLEQEIKKKSVFQNLTNQKNTNNNLNNHSNIISKKIEVFPSMEISMPIYFKMTPEFQLNFVGKENYWMKNIENILKNTGLNFLHYNSMNNSINYTYIPNINIKTAKENKKMMTICYCHLKSLIEEHIYHIINNKIKNGILVLQHEYQYATKYLQIKISKTVNQ